MAYTEYETPPSPVTAPTAAPRTAAPRPIQYSSADPGYASVDNEDGQYVSPYKNILADHLAGAQKDAELAGISRVDPVKHVTEEKDFRGLRRDMIKPQISQYEQELKRKNLFHGMPSGDMATAMLKMKYDESVANRNSSANNSWNSALTNMYSGVGDFYNERDRTQAGLVQGSMGDKNRLREESLRQNGYARRYDQDYNVNNRQQNRQDAMHENTLANEAYARTGDYYADMAARAKADGAPYRPMVQNPATFGSAGTFVGGGATAADGTPIPAGMEAIPQEVMANHNVDVALGEYIDPATGQVPDELADTANAMARATQAWTDANPDKPLTKAVLAQLKQNVAAMGTTGGVVQGQPTRYEQDRTWGDAFKNMFGWYETNPEDVMNPDVNNFTWSWDNLLNRPKGNTEYYFDNKGRPFRPADLRAAQNLPVMTPEIAARQRAALEANR